MSFNSLPYFVFLPIVFVVFYNTSDRFKWVILLVSSYIFYASLNAPHLIITLVLITLTSYFCGIHLAKTTIDRRRRHIFWSGVTVCILTLLVLKYLQPIFLTNNQNRPSSNFLISVGVSYFVFQAISYLIDIYLDVAEPERHLGRQALYLSFFPKLIQGPIERANDLLPQIRKPQIFSYDAVRSGMLLFTWGLFQKVVIADRLGFFVDLIFNDVSSYRGFPLLFSTYAYAMQIFFDFAAYTDMARGSARMFRIDLSENFNNPYLAKSIAEFWRRWHITFSRWILDYIFKPLQMAWRSKGKEGTAAALLITFLASGIWHGATYGFIIWGLLHGLYLATSTYYRPYQKKFHRWSGLAKSRWLEAWQVFFTFHLVCFAWIFFRANSVSDALTIITNLLPLQIDRNALDQIFVNGKLEFLIPTSGILIYLLLNSYIKSEKEPIFNRYTVVRWSFYMALVIYIMLFNSNSSTRFIYNNF